MKKYLLSLLLFTIPGISFTKPLANMQTTTSSLPQPLTYNSSYNTTVKANSERSPTGWWESIEDHFYPNIPTYYRVTSVNVRFGCWFSRDYGWYYKDFTFNNTLVNYLNQRIISGSGSFSFDYWGQFHTGGTKIYYTFPLTINNAAKQEFDPDWGGWVAWTQIGGVSIDVTFNVINQFQQDTDEVKRRMNTYVDKQTVTIDSDFSSSLVDSNNIPQEKTALDTLIKQALGSYYDKWKATIGAYAYNDSFNNATVTIKFYNPSTSQQMVWTFSVNINIRLTQSYWDKTLGNRLQINPGKVLNATGQMVNDQVTKWNGFDVYGTTAQIVFTGAPDGSETMKINGTPIQTINNKFTFNMTDSQSKDDKGQPVNQYNILLEKHDLQTWAVVGKYEVNYLIKQNIAQLNLKWYSWNPDKPGNENQKTLITPTLPDGSANPNYDREVNVKTGTKTQIIWVKHATPNGFPLDPLDQDGNVITNGNYDQGFMAEGSVSGMGIQQLFNDPWIKEVTRVKTDYQLHDNAKLEPIVSDDKGSYWSWAGNYHYLITDQKNAQAHKFILIGQDYQDKYLKFLDVLNNPAVAVDFWTTTQGVHLKNYLIKYKQIDSKTMQNLTFEQVMSYWKEYVSDVLTSRIGPDPNPVDYQDLGKIAFWTIKMNLTTVDLIKQEIIKQVQNQMAHTNLVYSVDYEIKSFDEATLNKLLSYDASGNATLQLNVNALATSTKAIGTNTITIINNTHYDPKTIVDLSSINFAIQEFNFSKFTVAELKTWILKDVQQTLAFYKINLVYQTDYGVKPLDDATLQQFLASKTRVSLNITIFAQDQSIKCINGTTLQLINNPQAPPVPPDPPQPPVPPTPQPDPNHHHNYSSNNITWIISVIFGAILFITGIVYLRHQRKKKGIGGLKRNITKKV